MPLFHFSNAPQRFSYALHCSVFLSEFHFFVTLQIVFQTFLIVSLFLQLYHYFHKLFSSFYKLFHCFAKFFAMFYNFFHCFANNSFAFFSIVSLYLSHLQESPTRLVLTLFGYSVLTCPCTTAAPGAADVKFVQYTLSLMLSHLLAPSVCFYLCSLIWA